MFDTLKDSDLAGIDEIIRRRSACVASIRQSTACLRSRAVGLADWIESATDDEIERRAGFEKTPRPGGHGGPIIDVAEDIRRAERQLAALNYALLCVLESVVESKSGD